MLGKIGRKRQSKITTRSVSKDIPNKHVGLTAEAIALLTLRVMTCRDTVQSMNGSNC
ncbi:hypothetical protein RE6C_02301 [Rhodopirellula europaea 6C]|uniref:Uncharacterized protein n=1 Tax=Rhodopirellula europaea 6C TaxID=1263867 RepID=M2B5G9_9BACT|nr:hypothetical protein RE6C_02301 [Rhodopirellula europaea 6C]